MDRQEFIVALAGIIFGCATVVTLIVTAGRIILRRRDRSPLADAAIESIDQRMSRMEQAIDAVAVEVERISEGQRFTTALLTEQRPERGRLRT